LSLFATAAGSSKWRLGQTWTWNRAITNTVTIEAIDSRDAAVERFECDVEADAILRAQADPEDFEALYQLYSNRIYFYLLRKTGNAENAADLTQQVFIRIFRSIRHYRPGNGPFAGWAFAIARNTHRTFLGKKQLEIVWDISPENALEAGNVISTPDSVGFGALMPLLAKLEPREQELIHLRFEIGLRIPEIASALGISNDAAKKAMQRTLKKIKDMYHDHRG
jgi:RNA polymerase sigma factor (sigma-70 family)